MDTFLELMIFLIFDLVISLNFSDKKTSILFPISEEVDNILIVLFFICLKLLFVRS